MRVGKAGWMLYGWLLVMYRVGVKPHGYAYVRDVVR
jgi:hypothetical protein